MTPLLVVDDVHATYGKFDVLRGVSLRVEPGELVAVLGPNGAGKSTLLKTIAGFLPPRQGSIRLEGDEIGALRPPRSWPGASPTSCNGAACSPR